MNTGRMLELGAVAVALAVAVCACEKRDDKPATGGQRESIDRVTDQARTFIGNRVSLAGTVAEIEGPQIFLLEENAWLFGEDIRVLTRAPVKLGGPMLAVDDEVLVTGTVRSFDKVAFERDLGLRFSPSLEQELHGKLVLVSDLVQRVEPSATWTADQPEGVITSLRALPRATPGALTDKPIALANVAVRIKTDEGLWVGPADTSQSYVVPAPEVDISNIAVGDSVDLSGTIRETPDKREPSEIAKLPPALRRAKEIGPLYIEAARITPAKKRRGGA